MDDPTMTNPLVKWKWTLETNDDLTDDGLDVSEILCSDGRDGLPDGVRFKVPNGANVRSSDDTTEPMRGKDSLRGLASRIRFTGAREYLPEGVDAGDKVELCRYLAEEGSKRRCLVNRDLSDIAGEWYRAASHWDFSLLETGHGDGSEARLEAAADMARTDGGREARLEDKAPGTSLGCTPAGE